MYAQMINAYFSVPCNAQRVIEPVTSDIHSHKGFPYNIEGSL